jgi:hypothetical protein
MKAFDQRKSPRIPQRFQVKFLKHGFDLTLEGITANVSQKGAFVRTQHWRSLQTGDPAVFTIFLPPDFTGQDKIVGLQGAAVVARIDQENEGIGVEFVKSLKQFEPVKVAEVAGKTRYKKLAYYLSTFKDFAATEFASAFPNGFLIEKTENFLDKDVMFQFLTDVVDDAHVLKHLQQGTVRTAILAARVIEVRKRKNVAEPNMITIGRSPENDIVIYNKMVSRRHAYLLLNHLERTCSLVDIGSTNGTFLNGSQITPHEEYSLNEADEISIGIETKVVYFSSEAFHTFLSELKSPHTT